MLSHRFFGLVLLFLCVSVSAQARFSVAGGEIADSKTGLTWKAMGYSVGADYLSNASWSYVNCDGDCWSTALSVAQQGDWRMPNIKELTSIVNYSRVGRKIYSPYFNFMNDVLLDDPKYFCSSTRVGGFVWIVDFRNGAVSTTGGGFSCYLLLVRDSVQGAARKAY